MDNDEVEIPPPGTDSLKEDAGKAVAEFIFIIVIAIISLAALFAAFSYEMVSARTPLTILVPMLILIAIQFNRVRKRVTPAQLRGEVRRAFDGQQQRLRSALALMMWMFFLLAAIWLGGHYAGMAIFLFVMLRFVARESWAMSIGVTVCATLAIYLLFAHVFNIELYRGLLFDALETAIG